MKKSDLLINSWQEAISIGLVFLLCFFAYTKSVILMYAILGVSLLLINHTVMLFPVMYVASLSTNYFAIGEGQSIGRYISLIFIISCVLSISKSIGSIRQQNVSKAVVLIVFSFFSTILGYDGGLDPFMLMLINLLVFYLFQEVKPVNIEGLVKVLCISGFFTVVLVGVIAYKDGASLLAERYNADGAINSNNLAMMVEQAGTFCLGYLIWGKHAGLRLVSLIGALCSVALILVAGSRSALIAFLAALTFCVFAKLRTAGKGNWWGSISIIVIVLIIAYLFASEIMSMDSPILERYSVDAVIESRGTRRGDLMKIILVDIFPGHFLFGSGMGTMNMLALGKPYNLENPCHNIIIDPLTQLGVIGYGLFLFLLLIPSIRQYVYVLRRKDPYCMIILAVITAVVFNGIGEIVFYEKFFWNDLALLAIAYRQITRSGSYCMARLTE